MRHGLLPLLVACVPNAGPEITALVLEPARPSMAGPVACVAEASDADGDALTWSWSWTVDGEPAGDVAVLAGPFPPDAVVVCTATARDGRGGVARREVRGAVMSGNTEVLAAHIVPDPVHADDAVSVEVEATDPDGATEFTVRWWVNRVLVADGPILALPVAAGFKRDDVVEVEVVGVGSERPPATDSAIVVNSAPATETPLILPIVVRGSDEVTATVAVTDPDGDPVTLRWRWTRTTGGAAEQSAFAPTAALPMPTRRGDRLVVTVAASDGLVTSSATSAEVTVVNTPPERPGVRLGGGTGVEPASVPLVCHVFPSNVSGIEDADGDPVAYDLLLERNGARLPPDVLGTTYRSRDTVPVEELVDGDVWTCTVTGRDGMSLSAPGAATTAIVCRDNILAVDPTDGEVDVSRHAVVKVDFAEDMSAIAGVRLVNRTAGAAHPEQRPPVWSSDGRHVWLHPEWPLAAESFHHVEIQMDCGSTARAFTTGSGFGPNVSAADFVGRTWAVDFRGALAVVEPVAAQALLEDLLTQADLRAVVFPVAWDAATSELSLALGARTAGFTQEACGVTTAFPAVDAVALPYAVLDLPGRTVVPSGEHDVVVHDLHLEGHFTARARGIERAHLRGTLDLETVVGSLTATIGVSTAEEACVVLGSFGMGAVCAACPDHGRETCMGFFLDDLELNDVAIPGFMARTEADVAADPQCAGSQASLCACASTDPRAGIGALVLLALGLRRRRA